MKHKKILAVSSGLVVLILLAGAAYVALAPTSTEQIPDEPWVEEQAVQNENINLAQPLPGTKIQSPVEISGTARGSWFFEADAPVMVVDWDGRIIGEGFISAEGDWMTTDFVPFSGTVSFTVDSERYSDRGTLILQQANPSGLPENDAAIEIPVILEE